MKGSVVQVSVSAGGVPNSAVVEATLKESGFVGDAWRYPFHGGPTRAVLLITAEGIEELVVLGFAVCPGELGENITSRGLARRELRLGQRFRVGEVVIELMSVRLPCDTLSVYGNGIQAAMYDARAQAGDVGSAVWGMSGFYCAVVEVGVVRAGDSIALIG